MKTLFGMGVVVVCLTQAALAQNPDYRIRASFRMPQESTWDAGQSIGNSEFRIRSRFGHVYYGGVIRLDDFKFTLQVDFTSASGFATEFPGSVYNTDYDAYVGNAFIGRVFMDAGVAQLGYDSRHPSPPDLPLPANFPEPINPGEILSLFAAASTLPEIGDPLPAGAALLSAPLQERNARGDVNQDGHVDFDDFAYLQNNFDPYHVLAEHIVPVTGDFTGDNRSDMADYQIMSDNWDNHDDIPQPPAATQFYGGDFDQDGDVDLSDLTRLLATFGSCSGQPGFDIVADLNHSGCVELSDLSSFLGNFGRIP